MLDYVHEWNQAWDKSKLAHIGVAYVLRASLSKVETFVCITLVGVLAARFTTYVIGIHSIFEAFVFRLTRDSALTCILREKIKEFVLCVLLRLYFSLFGYSDHLYWHGGNTFVAVAHKFTFKLDFQCCFNTFCSSLCRRISR